MLKTSALIISAVLITAIQASAGPSASVPDGAPSIGLLLIAISGLVIARKWFRTA